MAEVIRYVDPDATGSADGTSWTNAYTSLSAWEAAEQTDLVSDGDTHLVYCRASSGTTDTSLVDLVGWTTGASNYITIDCDSTYKLEGSSQWVSAFRIQNNYTTVIGLNVKNTASSSGGARALTLTGSDIVIRECNIYGAINYGIYDEGTDNVIINTIVKDCSQYGVYKRAAGGSLYVYNCTIIGNGIGVYGDDYRTIYLKNSYSGDNTTDLQESTNGTISITTSYTEDGSLSTTTAAYSTSSGAYFTDITAGSEDLHIKSDSDFIGNGTDLSTDSTYSFDIDKDDVTRSSWDIGVYEYVASGGTTYNEAAAESITLAETQGALLTLVAEQAESIDLAETQADTMLIPIAMSEGLELSETQSMISTLLIALAESMGLSESQSIGTNTFDVTVSESIGLAETGAGEFTLVMGLAEGIGLSELESAIGTFALSIAESMGLTDIYTSGDLASGKISVVIASSKSAININVTKSEITITGNKSGITITGV